MTRPDTAQRILDTSLDLFNRHGEANVTTNQIADELDISPGNLHYHFKRKREIVSRLFETFSSEMNEVLLDAGDRALELEDLWLYLHLLFETIGRYRFIYKDINDLLERYEPLARPFGIILERQRISANSFCNALVESGVLQIDDLDQKSLVDHIVMTVTFWIPFSEIDPEYHTAGSDTLARAIYQVISLAIPYLKEPERSMARRLSLEYLS
jgi:AcrR family transcriptional regulator